jgi:hypothetical protein
MYKMLKYDWGSWIQDFFHEMVIFMFNTRQFSHRIRLNVTCFVADFLWVDYVDVNLEVLPVRCECVRLLIKVAWAVAGMSC